MIIDDNLLLRTWETRDAQELFNTVNANREHLRSWLPWVDMTTRQEHSLQFIQMARAQQQNQEGMALGIVYNRNIIGGIGMHNWDHQLKKAQVGYWIAKEYEGQGILSKCLRGFVDFLFDNVGLNKIEIQFIVSNKRSAAVAERLGCKVEGIIRQSYLFNGSFHDVVITGLLKQEWQALPPSKGKDFHPA